VVGAEVPAPEQANGKPRRNAAAKTTNAR